MARGDNLRTHGMTGSPEHVTWSNMIQRCTNPKGSGYDGYGGRGIVVCPRWRKFENFLADMGRKPAADSTIERDDVEGHYEPGNCRWVPMSMQSRNRRSCIYVEIGGKRLTLKESCALLGKNYDRIRGVIRRGTPLRQALGI